MTVLEELVDDLGAESADLDALVGFLPAARWATPTPAPGWTIAHQIGHLLWTDRMALMSVRKEVAFRALVESSRSAANTFVDEAAAEYAAIEPPKLLADWRSTRWPRHPG